MKFLGITVDSKLSFRQHVQNVTEKATKILMQCRKAVGPTWGLSPQTCRWMYTAVIRPQLTYAVAVWVGALEKEVNRLLLRKVQRVALLMATGAMRSTATITLNKLNNLPDIVDYLKGEAANSSIRISAYGDWTREISPRLEGVIVTHSYLIDNYIRNEVRPPQGEHDLMKPVTRLERNFKVEISDRDSISKIIEDCEATDARICYTDGSKSEGGTGYGYVIKNGHTTIDEGFSRLPGYCSVYQAELRGIQAGADHLLKSPHDTRSADIFVDNQAALQQLQSTTTRSKTAANCIEALHELGSKVAVTLHWIPGHRGYQGNEEADKLAKLGVKAGKMENGYIPHSHLKAKIREHIDAITKNKWAKDAPRLSRLTIDDKTVQEYLKLPRVSARQAVQILSGHAALNHHLYKLKLVNSPACTKCGDEDETVEHFMGVCPYYARLRGQIFNDYYMSMTDICESHSLKQILKFVKGSKRLDIIKPPATR